MFGLDTQRWGRHDLLDYVALGNGLSRFFLLHDGHYVADRHG